MDEELKACPCCGEGAEIDTRQTFRSIDGGSLMEALAVYCTGCSLQIAVCYADVPDITAEQVIAMWNTRAQAASQGGEAVATDAFVPGSLADLLFQLGEKGIQVSGGTHGDHWKVTPLYTHPADQVADDLTMVKASRELLQDLRDLAFDQVEHHRAAMGAYKQTRQSAMDSVLAQADALLRS